MKNTLLVLLSLIMIVFSTSAFAKVVEKLPVERDGYYYEHFSPKLANGQYETYHKNGRLNERRTFKNGKPDGLYESYFDDGQLFEKGTYKNGKLEGLFESFYYGECFYQNGEEYECK